MLHSTPRCIAPMLALLTAIAAGNASALPHEAHHDTVKSCHFVGKVHASSGYGKHHDWRKLAKHRALVKAEKLGATHVVWHSIRHTGAFNGVADGKAYACKAHHPHHHSGH